MMRPLVDDSPTPGTELMWIYYDSPDSVVPGAAFQWVSDIWAGLNGNRMLVELEIRAEEARFRAQYGNGPSLPRQWHRDKRKALKTLEATG